MGTPQNILKRGKKMNIKKLLCLVLCLFIALGSLVACGGNNDDNGGNPETPSDFYSEAKKSLENTSYVETWTEKRTAVDSEGNPIEDFMLPNTVDTIVFEVNGKNFKTSYVYGDISVDNFCVDGIFYDTTEKKKAPYSDTDLLTIAANLGFNADNTGINSYEKVTVESGKDGGHIVKGTGTSEATLATLNAIMQQVSAGAAEEGIGLSFEFSPDKSFCEIVFDKDNRVVSSKNSSVFTISVVAEGQTFSGTYKLEESFTYDYKDVTVTLPNDVGTYETCESFMDLILG